MTCRSTAQFPELKEMKDMQEQLLELVNRLSLPQANEDTTKNTIEVLQGLLRTLNGDREEPISEIFPAGNFQVCQRLIM